MLYPCLETILSTLLRNSLNKGFKGFIEEKSFHTIYTMTFQNIIICVIPYSHDLQKVDAVPHEFRGLQIVNIMIKQF